MSPEPLGASGFPKLWHAIAIERGMSEKLNGSVTAQDYADVGVCMINGCPSCGATVAPYNSYQVAPDSPYSYCKDCA